MINLEKQIGLPVCLDEKRLIFGNGLIAEDPGLRKFIDFTKVIKDKAFVLTEEVAYSMYRGPYAEKDNDLFNNTNYRYDITVVSSDLLGEERMKTVGHYHPMKDGLGISFPEIYEVVHGEAHYLLQRLENGIVTDAIIIHAVAGDKVVIPPNYGHVTINPSHEILVMANVVEKNFSSSYAEFESKQGAIFYELKDGQVVKNNNYSEFLEPKIIEASKIVDVFNVQNSTPMYIDFTQNPKKYDFILNPEHYSKEFVEIVNSWYK